MGIKMILKIKAFLYRFSDIFGCRLYLAKKEEEAYFRKAMFVDKVSGIIDEDLVDDFGINLHRGLWHAEHGFTTVYTRHMPPLKALITKVKHAFTA
jgi:hypothetical protein